MVSVITCTMRQPMLERVFENFLSQKWEHKELIVILNDDSMDMKTWQNRANPYHNISIYRKPQQVTLGECLNFGVSKAKYDYIAKFDDDDFYSPFYLTEMMKAIKETGALVVGKASTFTYIEGCKALAVYKPNNEDKYNVRLRGATLVIKRALFQTIRFPRKNKGETTGFIRKCLHQNIPLYSTSKMNYVTIRRKDKNSHTQKTSDCMYLMECELIGYLEDYKLTVTNNFL